MKGKPPQARLKQEADALDDWDRHSTLPCHVPRRERIVSQPRELYRIPHFLENTASADQCADLQSILHEVWEHNENHVGEFTREAEVYFALNGDDLQLTRRCIDWSRAYLTGRSDRSRFKPQDRGDPVTVFERLVREFYDILGRLEPVPQSVNYVFFSIPVSFARWFLFQVLLKPLAIGWTGDAIILLDGSRECTLSCHHPYIDINWLSEPLTAFLRAARGAIDPVRLSPYEGTPEPELLEEIDATMLSIEEMRPFLRKHFHPEKFILAFEPNLYLAWNWAVSPARAHIFGAATERDLRDTICTHRISLFAFVRSDGLFMNAICPWITSISPGLPADRTWLPINAYLLRRFHDRLFASYARIDVERMRARRRPEASDSQVALACQHLAQQDTAEPEDPGRKPGPIGRHIQSLRRNTFLEFLRRHFAAEIRQGKGSEVTVYRQGTRKCILGCHTRNPRLSSEQIRYVLKRLDIAGADWCAAVDR